jgi:magnesium transporter
MMSMLNKRWVDYIGPTEKEIKKCSEQYDIDYHLLLDCLEPNHLPKKEESGDITFLILRYYDMAIDFLPTTIQEMSHKIAIFYKNDTIITIHRHEWNELQKISKHDTKHNLKPEEIVTMIMLSVLKSYTQVADELDTQAEEIEKEIFLDQQNKITLEQLYYLKSSCRIFKKVIAMNGEVIREHKTIERDQSSLTDVKDFLKKISHMFDEVYETSNNLSSIHTSVVSMKTNETMRILTVFTVFSSIATFVVGMYGMNFKFMPELEWRFGYLFAFFLIFALCGVIFFWLKRRKILN